MKKADYVWYASYGSNLLYERFISYIKGGECKFNGVTYPGCRDKSLPKDSRAITIPYKMYYSNKSSSCGNAGVSGGNLSEDQDKNANTNIHDTYLYII
ncbi:hypothetical protein LGK97_01710 [Clostridium sp. CS001]|uniref:hypothetical protein n=1 Tax=Clostridium sp. CS001 TaxID=2880648 RepID=UPI001CF49BBF|nr:hypothetical protein [Clostridium sp. CS001]MCB2288483.1 hypothetical protein [Clostridium sp. CS001]